MDTETVKGKLHQLIDQLEDNGALQILYAQALECKYSGMDDDPFTEEEWAEIDEGLAQTRNDEPCTHQAAMEKFREWQDRK